MASGETRDGCIGGAADSALRAAETAQAPARFFMYVVSCADGSLYTGFATDVEHRISQHNAGEGAKYTRSRRPVRLVAQAEFATQHNALSAEYRFKRLPRSRKLALIGEAGASPEAFAGILAREFGLGEG